MGTTYKKVLAILGVDNVFGLQEGDEVPFSHDDLRKASVLDLKLFVIPAGSLAEFPGAVSPVHAHGEVAYLTHEVWVKRHVPRMVVLAGASPDSRTLNRPFWEQKNLIEPFLVGTSYEIAIMAALYQERTGRPLFDGYARTGEEVCHTSTHLHGYPLVSTLAFDARNALRFERTYVSERGVHLGVLSVTRRAW